MSTKVMGVEELEACWVTYNTLPLLEFAASRTIFLNLCNTCTQGTA